MDHLKTSFWQDETGYVGAIIILMGTILMAYMLFIVIMPVHDFLSETFISSLKLADNPFYSTSFADRLNTAGTFGWKAPIIFVTIGFVYAIIRTIRRQQYTKYSEEY